MQFVSATTSAVGATWVALQSLPAQGVDLLNKTGTTLEFRRTGTPASVMQLPDGVGYSFDGITNLVELEFRRVDLSSAQVTIYGDSF